MNELLVVAQVARYANASGTTIRNWTAEYADYLSAHANPPKGTERRFTPEDIDVLLTVAVMREQLQHHDAIRRALNDGTRLKPADYEHLSQPPTQSQETATDPPPLPRVIETAIMAHLNRIAILERKVDDLTERLLEAEKRATAAETELRVIHEL